MLSIEKARHLSVNGEESRMDSEAASRSVGVGGGEERIRLLQLNTELGYISDGDKGDNRGHMSASESVEDGLSS
jgi:hypothetical protein